jgi:F0F1-type ATP synthase epsilon subunit
MKFESIKRIVEYNLNGKSEIKEKAKEDDNWLIFQVLINMGFAKHSNNKITIDCDLIDSMPSFESITRARRKLNEENKCLPSEKTIKKREQAQVEYKRHYKTKEIDIHSFPNSQYMW